MQLLCVCQCGSVRQFRSAAGGALGLAAVRLVPADAGSSVGRCSCCVLVSEDQFGSLIQQRAVLLVRPLCVWIRFWIRFGSSGSGLGVFFCQSGSFFVCGSAAGGAVCLATVRLVPVAAGSSLFSSILIAAGRRALRN